MNEPWFTGFNVPASDDSDEGQGDDADSRPFKERIFEFFT